MYNYLGDAAEHFDIARFIHLRTKVVSATLMSNRMWRIFYSQYPHPTAPLTGYIVAEKLVVATGLTSEPFIPKFKDQDQFRGLILHSKQLRAQSIELAAAKTVVVIGGNKSAWDVCYSVARRGGQAHMVLRPSGGGPSWVWPLRFQPWNMNISRMSGTRFLSLFDPWPFDRTGLLGKLREFFHRWALGRWLTACFWNTLGSHICKINGYAKDNNTVKLTPWYSLYWMGNSLGIHNYDSNWFDSARQGNIKVHIADIVSFSNGSVNLSDGSTIDANAVACCTGWKAEPPMKFKPTEVLAKIGVPGSQALSDHVCFRAREELFHRRPDLRNAPTRESVVELESADLTSKSGQSNPYSLYRYVVPAQGDFMRSKNLAFIGMHLAVHALMVAQAQALWITAFFEDQILDLKSLHLDEKKIEFETAIHVEYERLRRPRGAGGHGGRFPDLVFDCVPYIDLLLQDLKLPARRKRGVLAELFVPYRLSDYKGLVQDWKMKHRLGL